MGNGDDHVVAVFKGVGVALRQGQLDHHVRIELAVAGNQRRHQHTQPGQTVHTQPAIGLQVSATGFCGGLGHVIQYLPRPQQEAFAGFGQAQTAGGALQQTRLHVLLKIRHQPRHLRRGKVQRLCGGGKAACIGYTYKYAQAVKQVHGPSGDNDCCI